MRYCAEVRYFLSHDMYQEFTMFEPFIMTVAKEYDLNIDGISDYCVENRISFPRKMIEIVDYLYKNSNIYNKTKFFYQTIHESKYMFEYIINKINENLLEMIGNFDYQTTGDNGILDILNNMENLETFDYYLNFEDCYKKIYNKISGNIYFTLDEINKNEYTKRKLAIEDIIVYNTRNINGSTDTLYYNTRDNTQLNLHRTIGTGFSFGNTLIDSDSITRNNIRTSFNTINNVTQTEYLNRSDFGTLFNTYQNQKINVTPKVVPKKSKTKEYSVLKKSLKGITKFISYADINTILGEGLIISGKKFNFRIKANKKDLLRYSKIQDNNSISYDLELLDKSNSKICKICIVYKDCPILDEILTVYLSIKTGNEDKIIEIGNHFSRTDLYNFYFPKKDNENILNTIRMDSNRERKLHVLDIIERWVRCRFTNIIPIDTINYIFDAYVSWDEAIDYAGVNLSITTFDNMVKRVKWEELRDMSLIKMDKVLPKRENIITENLIREIQ